MEVITVGKITTFFPKIMEEIKLGKRVGIVNEGAKTPVAMIVPYSEEKKAAWERRQKLIKYSNTYNPLALAGVAEDSPLDLLQIRKAWTKKK